MNGSLRRCHVGMVKGQRWIMPKAGSLDQLRLEVFDESELQATEDLLKIEVRSSDVKSRVTQSSVQVKAIGLNFADIFACQGLYSATPTGSFVPGQPSSSRFLPADMAPVGRT